MNAQFMRGFGLACLVLSLLAPIGAQHRVDPSNMYERVLAVVPLHGSGTLADPKRPLYAPAPSAVNPASHSGILGYQFLMADDGLALVEFVAADRKSLEPILSDPSIKAFLKGRDDITVVLAEFKRHKKDFDFANFHGLRVQ